MLDSLDMVAAAWIEILDGRLWDEPEQSEQRQMRILKMGLQAKRSRVDLRRDYPFTELYVRAGVDTFGSSTFLVDLIIGFHINPDRDGDGDVDESDDLETPASEAMKFLVNGIRTFPGNKYSPYSLEKLNWQIGDMEGGHPGPDNYIVAATLGFQQQPIF